MLNVYIYYKSGYKKCSIYKFYKRESVHFHVFSTNEVLKCGDNKKLSLKMVMSLFFELPVLSTHGTLLLLLLWVEPLHYTVYMKAVSAFSPHQGAVITRCATVRATCFKWHSTYTTSVVIRYPLPCTDCCPVLDLYFHSDLLWIICRVSLKQGKQRLLVVEHVKSDRKSVV